jgi:HK97 family phage major capsid protein
LELPKETSGMTVYYPGEAGSVTDSDADFEKVKLEIVKRAARCLISNEVQADAVISMVDWVTQRMGYDFSYQRDNELINGNGTSTYGKEVGLLSALGAAGKATADTSENLWSELDIEDFQAAIALLPEKWFGYSPAWLCSRTFHAQTMAALAVAAGGNQIIDIQNGAIQQRFLGYPVIFTDQMPKTQADSSTCCLFGAFKQAVVIGDRNDMSMGVSEHAQWTTDQLDVRVTHRYDILVHEGGDASEVGAYTAVATNAA